MQARFRPEMLHYTGENVVHIVLKILASMARVVYMQTFVCVCVRVNIYAHICILVKVLVVVLCRASLWLNNTIHVHKTHVNTPVLFTQLKMENKRSCYTNIWHNAEHIRAGTPRPTPEQI